MTIIITGSRGWADKERIKQAFIEHKVTRVINGRARLGADRLAWEVARELGISTVSYPANWIKHGRAAGVIRNQEMLDKEPAEMLLAFWDGSSRGTKDMIDRAKAKGMNIVIYR